MAQGYLIAFDNSVLSPLVRARMGVKISQVDQQRGERAEALIDRILAHNSHAKTVQDHVRLAAAMKKSIEAANAEVGESEDELARDPG